MTSSLLINYKLLIMEKVLINSHIFLLGYELFYYKGEFDVKEVENFLLEKCSDALAEYADQTLLRSIPQTTNSSVFVKIKKAYQNPKYWFVVFELYRPIYKKHKGSINNTFVYIQGDTKITSITEAGYGPASELEGELIYSHE